jgi:hypothetical protein
MTTSTPHGDKEHWPSAYLMKSLRRLGLPALTEPGNSQEEVEEVEVERMEENEPNQFQQNRDDAALAVGFDSLQDKRLAVLVTTGALNPIHNGHVDMMRAARACLVSPQLW